MRQHILFLCFFILLPLACEELDKAPLDQPQHSIVGGAETNYEDWQGVIGLAYCPPGGCQSLCTGTLIDPLVVLTAGHCVYDASGSFDIVDKPQHLYTMGGPTLDIVYAAGAEIVPHPDWLGVVSTDNIDLAMIKLDAPILDVESYGITRREPVVDTVGKIVGYGYSDGSDPSTQGIHRVGDTEVQTIVAGIYFELGDPTSICAGDSGGPFLVEHNGEYNVAGVASFGLDPTCPADNDGHFVNIYPIRQWINDTMVDLVGHGIDMVTEPDPVVDSGPDDDSDSASGSDTGGSVTGTDFPSDGGIFPRSGRSPGCQLVPERRTGSLIDRVLLLSF